MRGCHRGRLRSGWSAGVVTAIVPVGPAPVYSTLVRSWRMIVCRCYSGISGGSPPRWASVGAAVTSSAASICGPAGRWLTCDDNTAFVPQFSMSVQDTVNWLRSGCDLSPTVSRACRLIGNTPAVARRGRRVAGAILVPALGADHGQRHRVTSSAPVSRLSIPLEFSGARRTDPRLISRQSVRGRDTRRPSLPTCWGK